MELKGVVAASQPRWIPVTERLPEINEKVLAYDTRGHIRDRILRQYMDGSMYFSDGLKPGRDVTHWMPLPEPPKKDNPELIGGVGE